ncbi:MAG TPA: SAF domain-containing protein [Thermoanaerobaculia bacterium]|nr:SAF domain-containing protein [Thermoanaerobaculia bacterium]
MAPTIENTASLEEILACARMLRQRRWSWLEGSLVAALLLIAGACAVALWREQGTVVLARDVGRGQTLTKADLVLASMPRMSGTFPSARPLPGKVAVRALEAGQPLRQDDLVDAAKARPGELEVPLRVFAGPLRPRPGDSVRLAAVSADGEVVVAAARVLSIDAREERADLRAAMARADAERIAALRSAQIRLMMEPKGMP